MGSLLRVELTAPVRWNRGLSVPGSRHRLPHRARLWADRGCHGRGRLPGTTRPSSPGDPRAVPPRPSSRVALGVEVAWPPSLPAGPAAGAHCAS